MLEPIDIDINMNQNISEEAPKAALASDEATKSLDAMQKKIEDLNGVIRDMKIAIAEQEKAMANSNETIVGANRKLEVMNSVLEKTEKELAIYKATCEEMNKATQEGADITTVMIDAKKALSETESTLVDNAKELINNQKDINDSLDEGTKNTDINSASNQLLGEAIKRVAGALGIENAQVIRSISNVHSVSAAKKIWTLVTTKLTAAQIALAATGVGAVVGALGAGVYAIVNWYQRQKELIRITNEEKNLLKESAAAVQEKVSKVQVLDKVLNDSTRTYNERNNALKQLKNIMPDYNAQLTAEGELIKDNTDALGKYVQKLLDVEMSKNTITKLANATSAYDAWKSDLPSYAKDLLSVSEEEANTYKDKSQWLAWDKKRKKYTDEIARLEKLAQKYVSSDQNTPTDNTKAFWEEQKQQAENLLGTMTDLEKGSEKWNAAVAKYKEAEGKLMTWDFKTKKTKTPQTSPEEKASTTLDKKVYDYQKRIDNARVKAIHDGAEKERQAAKAEYDQTQSFIQKELKSIADLEKKTGKPADNQRTLLLGLDVEATRQYEAEVGRINANSKKTIDAIFLEVSGRFKSELDRNIDDINTYYTDLIAQATEAGASLDQISLLQSSRDKDLARAKRDSQLEALDFETSITLQRIEASDKFYLFESDKIKELLNIELDAAQKRKAILEKQYKETPTDELAKSLLVVKQNIKDTEKAIEKLPAKKFQEIAGFVNQVAQSLGDIAGINLSPLSSVFDGILSFKNKDTMGMVSAGLGLASGIVGHIVGKAEREAEIKRQLVQMQQDYNILLRQQNVDLISSVDYARAFRDNMEALHWLIEKGFISDVDYSAWDALNAKSKELNTNILEAQNTYSGLTAGMNSFLDGMYNNKTFRKKWRWSNDILEDWKRGAIDVEEAMRRWEVAGGGGNGSEIIAKSREEIEKYKEQLAELAQQMDEFATGTNFDGFLNDAMNALDNVRKGVGDLGEFTEDTLTNAILSSFKYQILSEALKPFYDEIAKMFTTDFEGIDQAWANDWKARLKKELGDKGDMLDSLFDSLGVDSPSSQRQGATGLTNAASQDSVNEGVGLLYGVRQMLGDIRQDNREELLVSRTITDQLDVLVERSEDWVHLKQLPNVVKKLSDIETYGIPIKIK